MSLINVQSTKKNKNIIYEEINTHHPDCKNTFISRPILRLDNRKAANVIKHYKNILKREEHNVIWHVNINKSHFYRNGLHLNVKGTIALTENFISLYQVFEGFGVTQIPIQN